MISYVLIYLGLNLPRTPNLLRPLVGDTFRKIYRLIENPSFVDSGQPQYVLESFLLFPRFPDHFRV